MPKPQPKDQNGGPAVISAFDLFDMSSEAVQRNLNSFAILNLLPAATTLGSYIFKVRHIDKADSVPSLGAFSGLPTYAIARYAGAGMAIFIIIIIASLIVRTMLYGLQLEAAKGKTPDMSLLWELGKKYWIRLIGLSIVIAVYILGGLILLIIPGVIMFRRYFLAPFVMIDKDTSISESMRISAELSNPNPGAIWGIIGVSILISLPGFIPVIGWIVSLALGVLYSVAPALRYEELKKLAKI